MVTVAHAEAAAVEMLDRWDTLRTVVVTCVTAHVLLERWPSAWHTEDGTAAGTAGSNEAPDGEFIEHVVPRENDENVKDVIGAAECAAPGPAQRWVLRILSSLA